MRREGGGPGRRLQVVARTSKLTYEWRGMHHLAELLERLLQEDDELGAPPTPPISLRL